MSILLSILICLFLSAFFSGMEIAFLASNKLRLEIDKSKSVSQLLINLFISNSGMYITTLLVGNNVVMVIYGIFMAQYIDQFIAGYDLSVGIQIILETFVSTLLILIFAEFLPKVLFRIRANLFLKIFAVPVFLCYLIFFPVSYCSIRLGGFILRIFTGKPFVAQESDRAFGKIDLNNLIEENKVESVNKEEIHELKLFRNALDFSEVKLRDCIVPRTDVVAINIDSNMNDLITLFAKTGFSRILVYKESIDNVVGYAHVSSLFKNPKSISKIINQAIFVPETMSASHLLNKFIKQHRSLAVVVDEFGITAGIVTIEDIMEEIFGEIEDEHDHQNLMEIEISKKEYIFSGRLSVDYLNEKYKIGLKESEDYETLAGYILFFNENIPFEGEILTINDVKFEILKIQNARLEDVRIILN